METITHQDREDAIRWARLNGVDLITAKFEEIEGTSNVYIINYPDADIKLELSVNEVLYRASLWREHVLEIEELENKVSKIL